ncbi:hypothetical protein GGQ11_002928 [Salinibacter ruber]|uniref:hypothetical protein n=1 Tax=Salinibacter ruber TaxID=146919 RepID=UPI002166E445|nr:hypothetical protein [Salinibacter ruber]MCS3658127.1 hypothetical protein [Salinibacter ruber]MCS3824030.1 hypothetical protein [Salinibacter ruber]
MDLFDGLAFADESKQVDGKNFFIGKIRVGIVALSLGNCAKSIGPAPADEQINANERIPPVSIVSAGVVSVRVIHVAKGGL